MAVSRLSQHSIQNAFPKGNTVWDGTTATSAFDSLGAVLLSTSAATATFSNIPATYTHLQIRAFMLGSTSGVDAPYLRFNADTGSNYAYHTLVGIGGTGTPARAQSATSQTSINIGGFWNGLIGSTIPVISIIDVLDYANSSKNKTVRTIGGMEDNSTLGTTALASGVWLSNTAVNSLTIFLSGSTTFTANTQFSLYGIK
jgi:hypothetical protein